MGFIYGGVTRDMAVWLMALMAICRVFRFEFMAVGAVEVCQAALTEWDSFMAV